MEPVIIVLIILVVLVFIALIKTIQVIPQASAAIVERFGRYTRTLNAGLNIVVPFIDTIRNRIDLREQVVPFPPQPVITQDNLVVNIDTVIYYQVTDARAATYEVASYIQAIEQLTVTTLRNIIGGMDLERTLTSREEINAALRGVLDEATGKWGIRVNRVELKAIEPPTSIQDSMEKQMRADRDKRAAILQAEGVRQSEILRAEGEKQSQILRAEGEAKAAALRAEGEAQAVRTVFEAIHAGDPDQKLLLLPVPPDAPEDRRGRRQQTLDRPQRDRRCPQGPLRRRRQLRLQPGRRHLRRRQRHSQRPRPGTPREALDRLRALNTASSPPPLRGRGELTSGARGTARSTTTNPHPGCQLTCYGETVTPRPTPATPATRRTPPRPAPRASRPPA